MIPYVDIGHSQFLEEFFFMLKMRTELLPNCIQYSAETLAFISNRRCNLESMQKVQQTFVLVVNGRFSNP